MAKKRSSRTIGSSSSTHAAMRDNAIYDAERFLATAKKNAAKGQCRDVLRDVMAVAIALNTAQVHHVSGPGAGTERVWPGANKLDNAYHETRANFVRKCLVGGGLSGARRK